MHGQNCTKISPLTLPDSEDGHSRGRGGGGGGGGGEGVVTSTVADVIHGEKKMKTMVGHTVKEVDAAW